MSFIQIIFIVILSFGGGIGGSLVIFFNFYKEMKRKDILLSDALSGLRMRVASLESIINTENKDYEHH